MRTRVLTKEQLQKEVEGFLSFIQGHDERNVHNQVKEYFLDGEASEERFWVDFLFKADPSHWNIFEILHGGVAATLFDDCIGIAGAVARGESYVTTSSMSLQYIRGMKGKRFRLHAEITHVGGHMVTGHGEFYDEKGRLCVSCMASYTIHTDKADGPGRAL